MPDVDGIPSVTTILKAAGLDGDYSKLFDRDRAIRLGHAFHKAVELDAKGELDLGSIHRSIGVKFANYKKLVTRYEYTHEMAEFELVSPSREWCGHIDLVGACGGIGPVIVDLKGWGADLMAAAIQMAAYRMLWDECFPGRPSKTGIIFRFSSKVDQYEFLLEEHLPVPPAAAREMWTSALGKFYADQVTL